MKIHSNLSTPPFSQNSSKGFTLIELLVVIAIIGTLAAIAFPIINSIRDRGKRAEAATTIREMETAIDRFYHEYKRLPGADTYTESDTVTTDDGKFVAELVGSGTNLETNVNNIEFLAKSNAKNGANGMVWTGDTLTSLKDPWKTGYKVILDYDFNDAINLPTKHASDSKTGNIKGKKSIIWSAGKDLTFGTEDDIKSWK